MSVEYTAKLSLFGFTGRVRILHLTWFAFFISFVVWFNHAPVLSSREAMDLTDQQLKTLLMLNVALTIPARIVIGMLVDKFGPRITYTALLAIGGGLCFFFALAQS
jgi:MFS transporter, NNP family, nitrate/nitrite transporter